MCCACSVRLFLDRTSFTRWAVVFWLFVYCFDYHTSITRYEPQNQRSRTHVCTIPVLLPVSHDVTPLAKHSSARHTSAVFLPNVRVCACVRVCAPGAHFAGASQSYARPLVRQGVGLRLPALPHLRVAPFGAGHGSVFEVLQNCPFRAQSERTLFCRCPSNGEKSRSPDALKNAFKCEKSISDAQNAFKC